MKRTLQTATVVLLLVSSALAQDYLTGTVKSSDGKPLSGVAVFDDRKGLATTDSHGAFRIIRTQRVYFFRLSGYEPVTEVLANDQPERNVTMADSAGKAWALPNCADKISGARGLHLRYTIPMDATIKVTNDDDYSIRWVRYPHERKKEWLALWEGGTVSLGHPVPGDFLDAASYQERSITFENGQGGEGEDVRGVMKSGGLWRWSGGFGQFAEYRDASPAAAAYFDQIIDGMCNEGYPAAAKNSNATKDSR